VKTALSDEFLEESITLRGTKYVFREISAEQYETALKMAEGPDGTTDLSTVLRLMIPDSLVEPKLTAEQLYKKPLPVVTAIQNLVNRMHFRNEPDEAEGDTDDGEEKAPGNESEAQTS
jgi:hypothetical protein